MSEREYSWAVLCLVVSRLLLLNMNKTTPDLYFALVPSKRRKRGPTMLFSTYFRMLLFSTAVPPASFSDAKLSELNKLEREVFRFLNLESHPKSQKNTVDDVPKFMLELYWTKSRGRYKYLKTKLPGYLRDDTTRVFHPTDQKTRRTNIVTHMMIFNMSAINAGDEKITHAELRIHKRPSEFNNPFGVYTTAIMYWLLDKRHSKRKHGSLVTFKIISYGLKSKWLAFNITSALLAWAKRPNSKLALQLRVGGIGSRLAGFRINSRGKRKPFLVVFSDNRLKSRRRFDISLIKMSSPGVSEIKSFQKILNGRHRRGVPTYCTRRRLYVGFNNLRFNWIIAPKGFSAHYCSGSCPEVLSQSFNPTNHAIIQSLLHHRYNSAIPPATCVPTKLHSTSILYDDNGIITLKEFPGMVVSQCGCG